MPPLIEVEAVARYYQMGEARIAALDGVSFTIERGELVAIIEQRIQGIWNEVRSAGCGSCTTRTDTPSFARARSRSRSAG